MPKHGYSQTLEHRQRLSLSLLNHEVTEETRMKMSLSNTGKKRSPEICKRISKGMLWYWKRRKQQHET